MGSDQEKADPEIAQLLGAGESGPTKTFTQLIREGVKHHGGLATLAAAEQAGSLFGDSPAPVTRERYLKLAFPTGLPNPWTPELEATLPADLQVCGDAEFVCWTPFLEEADALLAEELNDPLIQWMKKDGLELTRERYLSLAYPDGLPEEWTAELEAQLPSRLRRSFPRES